MYDDRQKKLIQLSVNHGEKEVWARIPTKGRPVDPKKTGGLRSRDLFSYALTLCEAKNAGLIADKDFKEKLPLVMVYAQKTQDQNPSSMTYGNFWWFLSEKEKKLPIADSNGVEFCMHGAVVMWLLHQKEMAADTQTLLYEMMEMGLEAVLYHAAIVPERYTNIAILNTLNLILLGEILNRPEVADKGYDALARLCIHTWEWGIHEFCSPTYTPIQMNGLGLIARLCERQEGKTQALGLLHLIWNQVMHNWIDIVSRLGGAHSRLLNLKSFEGRLLDIMYLAEKVNNTKNEHAGIFSVFPVCAHLHLLKQRTQNLPEGFCMLKQRWGFLPTQDRRHFRYHFVPGKSNAEKMITMTLSSAGAQYDLSKPNQNQDLPLTVDINDVMYFAQFKKPGGVSYSTPIHLPKIYPGRCYFLPDDGNDPYGKEDDQHYKPLLWAAAQETCDVLGTVLYTRKPDGDPNQKVTSNFLMPFESFFPDEYWIGDNALKFENSGKPGIWVKEGERLRVDMNEALILRKGPTAMGIRVVWANAFRGGSANILFYYDSKDGPFRLLRLLVEHGSPKDGKQDQPPPGAVLWVRIGSDLNDRTFEKWRKAFAKAKGDVQTTNKTLAEDTPWRLHAKAERTDGKGDVVVQVATRDDAWNDFVTHIEPEPAQSVLEVNGKDYGRPKLEQLDPIRAYKKALPSSIDVPGKWEAESGRVWAPMGVRKDPKASGGSYVWWHTQKPGSSYMGSVTWQLRVANEGMYHIFSQVQAPKRSACAFWVRISAADKSAYCFGPVAWVMDQHRDWTWVPMTFYDVAQKAGPTPVFLPKGEITLQIFAKEAGFKIDCLKIESVP